MKKWLDYQGSVYQEYLNTCTAPVHPCTRGISTSMYVIQRGNNRQVYFAPDEDFAAYAHWLYEELLLCP